jgi:hypothetical protein
VLFVCPKTKPEDDAIILGLFYPWRIDSGRLRLCDFRWGFANGGLEVTNAFAKSLTEFAQFLGSENQKCDTENDEKFGDAEFHCKCSLRLLIQEYWLEKME